MIIGITKGARAGKTTVARTIAERIGKENVSYLSQDLLVMSPLVKTRK